MQEFTERQPEILDCLLSLNYDHRTEEICSCSTSRRREYRCVDCFMVGPCCEECIVRAHVHAPFHHIEHWTGTYFARHSLSRLGAELCLGHSGTRCPNAGPLRTRPLVIVHTNGVHKVTVTFCGCAPETAESMQLLCAGLYPATWTSPATAFTTHVLKHYHLDSLQSRKPAYDYWAILRRLTDNTRHDPIPDRYEELLRVSREWRALMLLKRSGQALGISELLPHGSRSVAIHCPACPRPGVNLEDNWKDKLTSKNQYAQPILEESGGLMLIRHVYTVFIGIDGNFQAVLKAKRHDVLDEPLVNGRAYFTPLGPFAAHMKKYDEDDPGEVGPSYEVMTIQT
ncbi:hypothetical protein AURDEDRAFT_57413 [Auricularia subglabra TFB-10046 SS5]|nr:hypothetical protein AURDEDRAFT_57413 [Auricularia subglabra TFB-10046 SS5]